MKEITGIIDHRILLNYRIDPTVIRQVLPDGFEPSLVNGFAIGGICQVSLSEMRPKCVPACGSSSHNAAHRIAVETKRGSGVYVPRRDTDSWLNAFTGGKLFPGAYHQANFDMNFDSESYDIRICSKDGNSLVEVKALIAETLPSDSVFKNIEEASQFFKQGNLGWSPTKNNGTYDAIELMTTNWNMEPLQVQHEYSAFFTESNSFPEGSVVFDCGLIMRGINHSWVSQNHLREICC